MMMHLECAYRSAGLVKRVVVVDKGGGSRQTGAFVAVAFGSCRISRFQCLVSCRVRWWNAIAAIERDGFVGIFGFDVG